MANEMGVTVSATYAKGSVDSFTRSKTFNVTVSGTVLCHSVLSVTTSEMALPLNSVAAGGVLVIENLDPTNYVTVKSATGVAPLVRLKPGEQWMFRLDAGATAPFVQANTSAVVIEYTLFSD